MSHFLIQSINKIYNSISITSINYNIYNDLFYCHDLYKIGVLDKKNNVITENINFPLDKSVSREISSEALTMELLNTSCTEDLCSTYIVSSSHFSVQVMSNNEDVYNKYL